MIADSQPNRFKLVGGSLSLDFVNTVGGRDFTSKQKSSRNYGDSILRDKLAGYSDLVAWARHADLLVDTEASELLQLAGRKPRAASAVFERALKLRDTIYRILKCTLEDWRPDPTDVAHFNQELLIARIHERLVPSAKKLRWGWDAPAGKLDRVLWPLARSAAELLTSGDLSRLRQCTGDDCGWLFLDSSRNHSRQWCDMKDCGNVAKVRRFRQRRQEANME